MLVLGIIIGLTVGVLFAEPIEKICAKGVKSLAKGIKAIEDKTNKL